LTTRLTVTGSVGLSRQTGRAHTQETKEPKDDIKHHRAYGDGPDVDFRAKVARNCGVRQSKNRHCDIADNGRNAQPKYFSIQIHVAKIGIF
jgi:hypothetical protein